MVEETLHHFLGNGRFRRVWIFQEHVLARSTTFLCGGHQMDTDMVADALFEIMKLPSLSPKICSNLFGDIRCPLAAIIAVSATTYRLQKGCNFDFSWATVHRNCYDSTFGIVQHLPPLLLGTRLHIWYIGDSYHIRIPGTRRRLFQNNGHGRTLYKIQCCSPSLGAQQCSK